VCRPNNPTGTLYEGGDLARLANDVRGVLAIDEAYADYAGTDAIQLAMNSDNVVVVRTMSKAFGLAGMRIGFAIGPAPLVREIEKSRGPYKVGGLAESAALAALRHDDAWVRRHVAEVVENRDRLAEMLRVTGLSPLPSSANFLLVPVPAPATAAAWGAGLRAQGVAIRAFEDLPGVGDAIRVSVGPWPLMERFVNALDMVRAGHTGKMES
jgi:histidinol-phosphate/aromatic aminotransferase/cobyric acid decarboxylase-like protein